ncbi:MAG TPA: NUMOD1 domain-containing DNA-binding protein [Chitinophagaceae bacterium]
MATKSGTHFKDFPYQRLELKDLPVEKWKWLPGLEGYYKISNFGRVKRESFEMMTKDGKRKTIQEKMLKGELQKFPNRYIGDENYHLRARITREGIKHEVSIARMTYYCFTRKFNLDNTGLMVLAKDGDGRNIRLDNLVLVDSSQKQKRIYERKRFKKPVIYSYYEFSKGLKKSANSGCKQVTQYTMEGIKVKTYPSIRAAAIHLSLSESGINAVLKERQVSSGGFVWRYGMKKRVDLKPLLEKRAVHRKILRGTKVSQYDGSGRRLNVYLTMADAEGETNIGRGEISATINGKQKSAGGFIWRKGWGRENIRIPKNSFGEALRARARWKKVRQYDKSGKYIKTFVSLKAAAAFIKLSPSSISNALKSESNLAGGYRWSRE